MLKILIACLLLPSILSACLDPAQYEYSLKTNVINPDTSATKQCLALIHYIPNCKFYRRSIVPGDDGNEYLLLTCLQC